MGELARRTTISEMRCAWNSVSDINKSTGYAKSTVYRVVAAFDAEGEVQRNRYSPRSDRKNQNFPCRAETDVEVRPKPADVKTGTRAQRESKHHQQGSPGRPWNEVIRKESP